MLPIYQIKPGQNKQSINNRYLNNQQYPSALLINKADNVTFKSTTALLPLEKMTESAKSILEEIPEYESSTLILLEIQEMLKEEGHIYSYDQLIKHTSKLNLPENIVKKIEKYKTVNEQIVKRRETFKRAYNTKNPHPPRVITQEYLNDIETSCKQFGVANCGEYALLVAKKLVEKGANFCMVNIKPTDPPESVLVQGHTFICINYNYESTLKELYDSPDAIIIDAWDRTIAPAKEQIQKVMRIFETENLKDLEYDFDPYPPVLKTDSSLDFIGPPTNILNGLKRLFAFCLGRG